MELNLNTQVCKKTGFNKKLFKKEFQNTIDFCSFKEFIDNPDTVETFRFMNSYDDNVTFSNDIYEYLDSLFYNKDDCANRKAKRDDNCR